MEKLISIGIWYLIFAFIMTDWNPLDWSMWAKIIWIILALLIAGQDD